MRYILDERREPVALAGYVGCLDGGTTEQDLRVLLAVALVVYSIRATKINDYANGILVFLQLADVRELGRISC
jgi:hypothetical protein